MDSNAKNPAQEAHLAMLQQTFSMECRERNEGRFRLAEEYHRLNETLFDDFVYSIIYRYRGRFTERGNSVHWLEGAVLIERIRKSYGLYPQLLSVDQYIESRMQQPGLSLHDKARYKWALNLLQAARRRQLRQRRQSVKMRNLTAARLAHAFKR